MSWRVALMWGTVIVVGVLATAYFLFQSFMFGWVTRTSDEVTHKFADMTPEKRPQDPNMDGTGLRFQTMEHGGEYPDTMPQATRLIRTPKGPLLHLRADHTGGQGGP
jgi:hypothetical protein